MQIGLLMLMRILRKIEGDKCNLPVLREGICEMAENGRFLLGEYAFLRPSSFCTHTNQAHKIGRSLPQKLS